MVGSSSCVYNIFALNQHNYAIDWLGESTIFFA